LGHSHDQYPSSIFSEQGAQRRVKQFQYDLEDISEYIQKRNTDLDVPYTYMLPEKVPNSITI
jgi:arachidonate 5-lipoxygenase